MRIVTGIQLKSVFLISVILLIGFFIHKGFLSVPNTNRTHFLILTNGHTGTNWLAAVLNSYPEINCSHYTLDLKNSSNLKSDIYAKLSLQDYFHKLDKQASKTAIAVGNIHGFIYQQVADQLNNHPEIIAINMVRHPIARIASAFAHWKKYDQKSWPNIENAELYAGVIEYQEKLKPYFDIGVHKNQDQYFFLRALAQQDIVYEDTLNSSKDGIAQLKLEDIAANPTTQEWLLEYISNGKITADEQALKLFNTTPISNQHYTIKLSDKERFASWEPWQKSAFVMHILKHGTLNQNVYVDSGYDLGFLNI